jgi:hypothetical protein
MDTDNHEYRNLPVLIRVDAALDAATVSAVTAAEAKIMEGFVRAGKEAALSPIGADGKPRMLKITAWIAHAGKPNRNGDGFLQEDLEEAIEEGLFIAPNIGMIDFNHDFSAYGAWYNARLEYDPQAKEYGIIAEGAIWAWRYEEMVNTLLAMQQRNGYVEVSMSCLPRGLERALDTNGREYTLVRRPVFFTTSVLDMPPADPHARGLTTEDSSQTSEEREEILLNASEAITLTPESLQEGDMDYEKLIAELRAALAEGNTEMLESLTSLVAAAARVPALEAELTEANDRVTELDALVQERDVRVATLETSVLEGEVALTAARETLATATEELEVFRAERTEREAADAAAARTALRNTRVAEISEVARRALEGQPVEVQEKIIEMWTDMDDIQWDLHKTALNLVPQEGKYEGRSKKEGGLSGTSEGVVPAGAFAIDKYFNK